MTQFGWIATTTLATLIVLSIGGMYLYISSQREKISPPSAQIATTTQTQDPTTLALYSNGAYGLSFAYPSTATLIDTFSSTTLPTAWSGRSIATGTTIAVISLSKEASIHVGESGNKKEIAQCTKVTSAEESFGDLVVGSTTWTHTSFDRLGTEDEKVVESYRTLHNDICFALELVTPKNISADPSRKIFREILMSFTFAEL